MDMPQGGFIIVLFAFSVQSYHLQLMISVSSNIAKYGEKSDNKLRLKFFKHLSCPIFSSAHSLFTIVIQVFHFLGD